MSKTPAQPPSPWLPRFPAGLHVPAQHATPGPSGPWDDFMQGPENALAVASIQALARCQPDGDGLGWRLLMLHGPSGSGKTRLLAALVDLRLLARPESALALVHADEFAQTCAQADDGPRNVRFGNDHDQARDRAHNAPPVDAVENNIRSSSANAITDRWTWGDLRRRFRNVDMFILDDLPDLGRFPAALEELEHTLDALDERGALAVFASRVPPSQLAGWPRRLVNRLQGGMSAALELPGEAGRRRYVLNRAVKLGLRLQSAAVDALVNAADSYPMLDGWLTRLRFAQQRQPRSAARRADPPPTPNIPSDANPDVATNPTRFDISPEMIQSLFDEFGPETGEDLATVARLVSQWSGVALGRLRGKGQRQAAVQARQTAIYLAHRHCRTTVAALGRYFGNRDPATIRHALAVIEERRSRDPTLDAAIAKLSAHLPRHLREHPKKSAP